MKRIIGLICIFSIICSFQINSAVFASPETEAIYQNYEESVLIQLGFIESDSSEHMTRLEFVEILLKMLSFDAIDDGSENPFTDISTSHSGYPALKSAYNLGIMSGGLARPNDMVTYNEAVKMVVCATGYGVYAPYKGGYPTGYIFVASENDITKGVWSSGESITRSAIYVLLYNAMHTDLLLNTGVSDSLNYSTVPGKNLLYTYHNIVSSEDICYGVYGYSVISASNIARGEVIIGNHILKDPANISYDYVGYNTEYYYNSDTKELKAIISKNTKFYELDADKVFDYRNHTLYYDDNGSEIRYRLDASTMISYNGDIIDSFSSSDFVNKNGYITLIENTGDTIIDTMLIRSYDAIVVGSVDVSGCIIYDYYTNASLKIDKNDSNYLTVFKDELGNDIELKELSKGDVITYSKSKSGKIILATYSNSEIIGEVETVSKDNSKYVLTIDETEYETTKDFGDNESIKPGISGAFRLTTDKRIAAVKYDDTAKYAYLIAGTKELGIDGRYQLKIFNEDSKMLIAYLAKNVYIDGSRLSDANAYESMLVGASIPEQLIRYELNANDEISFIDTIKRGTGETANTLHRNFSSFYDENGNARTLNLSWRDVGMFGGKVPVNASGIMFVVPKEAGASDENYIITTPYKYFVHDQSYGFDAYKVDEKELISDVLVYKSDTSANTVDRDSGIAVVNNITSVSHDGMECLKFSIYTKGALEEYFVKDENVLKVKLRNTDSEYHSFTCGDVIRFKANDIGYITAFEPLYDVETDRFKYDSFENTSSLLTNFRVAYGEVYAQASGIIQFHKGMISGSNQNFSYEDVECYKASKYTIYTYDSSERFNPLRLGGVYDITDYKTTGQGTKMIVYCRNGFDGTIVLYK